MFKHRAHGSEFLDGPGCDRRLAKRSYQFMQRVNRIGGGTRAVVDFFAQELPRCVDGQVVRILDLGAGGCDIPIAVTEWAGQRGYKVEFTCVDHNAEAIEMARQALANRDGKAVTLEQADIFSYQPGGEFDFAVGSMAFHHFTADEIDRLIARLRHFVRRALLINDLRRCALNYAVCYVLARRLPPEIRHDALLSIRRGFRRADLLRLLSRHDPTPLVKTSWFCRVTGVVRFDREGTA